VQIQNRDQTILDLTSENDNLTSALNFAETRINELYTEQSRSEVELAQRIDISEKLRAQVRELEKEKRDVQRRYNEQVVSAPCIFFALDLQFIRRPHLKQSVKHSMITSNT
jgi:predicted nuclease with TOPRIM domain